MRMTTALRVVETVKPLGVSHRAAYDAARDVVRAAGHIPDAGPGRYWLTRPEIAETALAALAGGSAIVPDVPAFMAAVRVSGFLAAFANLAELAWTGEPEHLAESSFTFDGSGRVRWCYVARRDRKSAEIEACDFGIGAPMGRTFTIDGARLAEALAGLAD